MVTFPLSSPSFCRNFPVSGVLFFIALANA
jgi:hypothetical protein